MKHGTLIDGIPVLAPNPLHVGDYNVFNPTDAQYKNAGYLPIVETMPPDDDEPKYYAENWVEQDGKIVRVWTETDPPTVDDAEAEEADYLAALERFGVK